MPDHAANGGNFLEPRDLIRASFYEIPFLSGEAVSIVPPDGNYFITRHLHRFFNAAINLDPVR
jgi:hypothetical protein